RRVLFRSAWVTPLAIGAAVASAVWLLVVAIYIQTQYGWDSVGQLLPHELGAGLAGIAAPLAFLWLVVAFVERGRELRRQVDLLGRQLDNLIYQPAADSSRYQSVAQGLREQAKILSDAPSSAAERLEEGRQAIANQTQELNTVSEQVAMRSSQLMGALRRHADSLERLTGLMATKSQVIEGQVRTQAELLAQASERAAENSR